MWPEIPDNLEGKTSAEVRELATKVAKALAAAPTKLDDEQSEEWKSYQKIGVRLNALADTLKAAETLAAAEEADRLAAEQAEADRLAAEQAEAERLAAEQAEAERLAAEQGNAGDGENDGENDGGDGQTPPVSTNLGFETQESKTDAPKVNRWVATGATNGGPNKGSSFDSLTDLAAAVQAAAEVVQSGGAQKLEVAKQYANWGDRTDYQLSENPYFNLNRFEGDADEIEAAFCAPATPLYDLACDNVTRRPVYNGLPVFQTPTRGAFTVFPSPSLSDITGGYGQWTSAHDNDPEAIKAACQTIQCGTPTTYEIYGVYRCLTVKNLMQMTFPELVRAYLNRLEAAWARYAETLLLEAMGNASVQIDAPAQGFGANVSLKRIILTYLGLYQEIERWDVTTMDAWMPRWLQFALKVDAASRKRTDGSYASVPSNDEIDGWFRDVGVEPHWYLDRPSWATPVPTLATSGDLNFFPSSVEILIHKRGKFALLDRGDLTIGVSPNNIYRLNDDLRRNQYTMFFESFEGLIDTDSCPAHILQIPGLCYNGAQIADVAIACEGYDVVGIGS